MNPSIRTIWAQLKFVLDSWIPNKKILLETLTSYIQYICIPCGLSFTILALVCCKKSSLPSSIFVASRCFSPYRGAMTIDLWVADCKFAGKTRSGYVATFETWHIYIYIHKLYMSHISHNLAYIKHLRMEHRTDESKYSIKCEFPHMY